MAEEKGTYSLRRIELFDRLLGERAGVLDGHFLLPDPKTIRFKYGEILAELKIPYLMGGPDEASIEDAVTSLAVLLGKRYEPAGGDKIPSVRVPPLKEKTFRTDLFIAGSCEKTLAGEILKTTPHIDSSMLSVWLSPEGKGRGLVNWVSEFFEKMLREEAGAGGERTGYLALLAAAKTVARKKEKIKGVKIKGLPYEKFDLALGLTLFAAFRLPLMETLRKLRGGGAHTRATEELLDLALTPGHFVSVQGSIFTSSLNPYWIGDAALEALRDVALGFGEGKSIGSLVEGTAERVKKDARLLAAVKRQSGITRFRTEALEFMSGLDVSIQQEHLHQVYGDDRLIGNYLDEPARLGKLIEELEGVKKTVEKDPRREAVVSSFLEYLSSLKKGVLEKLLTRGEGADVEDVLCRYYAAKIDEHVEKFTGILKKSLYDKRGELSVESLMEEYRKGRVYRFSTDEREVVRTLEVEEEGQLFVDMKDFTRKTLRFKEIAMADFMKENFLKPILKAASRYSGGFGDESDIRLTNIPGDAAIFSGSVRKLVSLAKDVQEIIGNYREEVLKRLPLRRDEVIEEVHRRFEERRDGLKRKRMELMLNAGAEEGAQTRLVSLGEEETRLDATYREELEEAIRGELEAGLYISYGAKAEVISLDPVGNFSGEVKVSVAEKINESARGTFRNLMIRAKLEMLISEEKKRRNTKELAYPFDIYIDSTYSLRMPPEIENAFEKLLSTKRPGTAEALSHLLSQEYLNDLKKVTSGEPFSSLRLISSVTDIYNKGQALSEAALLAYMKETRGRRRFFRKAVPVSELDAKIKEAFFFPKDLLDFWFGVETEDGEQRVEVFLRSGEILFRGFETAATTVVYEMLDPKGEFFGLLVKKHFPEWLEEAKREGSEGGA